MKALLSPRRWERIITHHHIISCITTGREANLCHNSLLHFICFAFFLLIYLISFISPLLFLFPSSLLLI